MTPDELDYRKILLPASASVRDAIEVMTDCGTDIILVAGKDRKLKGILVDSDIRKGILSGHGLESPLSRVMNASPSTLPATMSREALTRFFTVNPTSNIPPLDTTGRVSAGSEALPGAKQGRDGSSCWWAAPASTAPADEAAQALLHVGDKPLLETIIDQFLAGLNRFVLAVNHR